MKVIAIASHGPRTVERFIVGDLWCLHFYRYRSRLKIGADTFEIHPGCMGITPPGAQAEYVFNERSTHGFVHFEVSGTENVELAPMIPMGDAFVPAWSAFENALGIFPSQPLRTEIKVWDLLWQHAEQTSVTSDFGEPVHPAVSKALRIIEARMGEQLSVSHLAESVGISHNHLTRLFQKHMGKTVVAHVIERRLIRAEHMLRHSNMPVKQIASQVGIPDLQAFNKAIRSRYHMSPRELRGAL